MMFSRGARKFQRKCCMLTLNHALIVLIVGICFVCAAVWMLHITPLTTDSVMPAPNIVATIPKRIFSRPEDRSWQHINKYFDTIIDDEEMENVELPKENLLEERDTLKVQKWNFALKRICRNPPADVKQQEDLTMTHQLPSHKQLCSLTVPQIERTYAWYFNNIQTLCGHLKRFGKVKDGGWDVCVEESLVQKNNCLVYSFGIDFDFSFDDEISEEWGCTVHSFDPSMSKPSHRRSFKVFFHNIGLSNFNGTTPDANWTMLTFQGLRQRLSHEQVLPDVIKMDIEDWEWHVIPEMLSSKSFHGIKQFLVEFHFSNIPEADSEGFWISKFFLIKEIYALGFRMTWATRNLLNVWRSRVTGKDIIGCFEVTFIRRL